MDELNGNTLETTAGPTTGEDTGNESETVLSQEDSTESSSETSVEESDESTESADTEASVAEETESEDPDELPDEQLKEFPLEVIAKYAKRYGYTEEDLRNDPRAAKVIKDKINADIFAKQLREQSQAEEPAEDEPIVEEPAKEPTLEEKAKLASQRLSQIEKFVDEINDPEVAVQFNSELIKAYEEKDPKKQGIAATKVYTKYMMNFLDTVLPRILPHYLQPTIDNVYPEFSDMHRESLYARAWNEVKMSDPEFADLPDYGKAKTSDFGKLMDKAAQQIPNIESIKFVDKNGKPLPPKQQAVETYKLVAKVAKGQKISPALVQKVEQTAKKKVAESQQKRSLGKALGSGQSKNSFGRPEGNDDLDSAISQFRKDSTPFGK